MKNIITFCLSVCLIVTLAACSLSSLTSSSAALATQVVIASSSDVSAVSTQETLATVDPVDVDYDDDDFETNVSEADVSFISLEGETITLTGVGAEVSSSTVTITSAGTYRISGTLNDGQIIVDTADSDSVVPILDGVDLTSTTSAPIYVRSADKTIITLADGTQNIVTDGTSYVFDDAEAGEPDAAIFSKDDLTINGRPGQNEFADSGNYHLYICGGYVFIDAEGDGLDTNGAIDMTGGTVIVNGPTGNNNGALDYMGSFNLQGGLLVAVGSAGMAEAPSTSSTQYSVIYNFQSALSAGTLVHFQTAAGEEILTFASTKTYQSVVFSSPDLENGETYQLYTGGSSSGVETDGLYSDGIYSAGTQVTSFTISSMVTGSGGAGGGGVFPGGGPGRQRP